MEIHQGVPGGGKTTLIKQLYADEPRSKVILVKSRENVKQLPGLNVSLIGNTGVRNEQVVFVDEYIMSHPGDIIRTIGPKVEKVVLVGDLKQLNYHCPLPWYNNKYGPEYFSQLAYTI